jgi:ATP-dependent DNA ligase
MSGTGLIESVEKRQHDHTAFLYAFDLLALDGRDLRREPFETRKVTLASLLRLKCTPSMPDACGIFAIKCVKASTRAVSQWR